MARAAIRAGSRSDDTQHRPSIASGPDAILAAEPPSRRFGCDAPTRQRSWPPSWCFRRARPRSPAQANL
jgi:hypothetical protein